ncbi:MAG: CoA transferase [Emcibacter sp.]|nr:CoA transferase [Emcibacter sp.]
MIEISHMVMGPACGMFLAFLGAEVIKVEPVAGDKTRELQGMGLSMFPLFNRGKKSIQLDIYSEEGRKIFSDLLVNSDVLIENFKDGALAKMGLAPDDLKIKYPKLILCSHKGFLSGPYKQRTALDEVVQMMTGLAYMTGPEGSPLRVGSSINDIMGGLFGAIAVLATLIERDKTGVGREVRVGLFETCLLFVSQHMVHADIAGVDPSPMPERDPSWPIYDIFETKDKKQLFVGVVTEMQWEYICESLDLGDFKKHENLQSAKGRLAARPWMIPQFADVISQWQCVDLQVEFEKIGVPFAVVGKPSDMFDDPHVMREGGLVQSELPNGKICRAPALPFEIDGDMVPVCGKIPVLGADNDKFLSASSSREKTTEIKGAGI